MKDWSSIDKINLIFIALTGTGIHHCLLAWKTWDFRVWPEFHPASGGQHQCHTRNIDLTLDRAYTDVSCHPVADFHCSLPLGQAEKIYNICGMIHPTIHSPGIDPVMTQHLNDQGRIDEGFLDYMLVELIKQSNNSFNRLSSIVAATVAWMRFPGNLPMGGSAITSSSQPVPCSNSNKNISKNLISFIKFIWFIVPTNSKKMK